MVKYQPPKNPNRMPGRPGLHEAVMSEPVSEATQVKSISPTGKPVLPQALVITLTVLAVLAGGVAAVGTAGVAIPPVVVGIAAVISSLCAAFGIVSPGARTQPKE